MFKLGDIVEITGPSKFGSRHNIGKTVKISEIYTSGAYGVELIENSRLGGVHTSETLKLINNKYTFKAGDKARVVGPTVFRRIGEYGKVITLCDALKPSGDNRPTFKSEESGMYNYWPESLAPIASSNKCASIIYEKLVIDGVKCVKILELKNMKEKKDLPLQYISGDKHFSYYKMDMYNYGMNSVRNGQPVYDGLRHKTHNETGAIEMNMSNIDFTHRELRCFEEEAIFTEEDFKKIVAWMKECGERLAKINQEIKEKQQKEDAEKKLKESWHEIHEVTI